MTRNNVPVLLTCSNTFTSRELSIVHRPVALCLSTNQAMVVREQPIRSTTWLYESPPSTIPRARWRPTLLRRPIGLFLWNVLLAFYLKNTDLIMTVKIVPKISWLRKFEIFAFCTCTSWKSRSIRVKQTHSSVTTLQYCIYQLKKSVMFTLNYRNQNSKSGAFSLNLSLSSNT